MQQSKATLCKRRYSENNAAVKREDFRAQMHYRFKFALYLTFEIEKSLSRAEFVEIFGEYLRLKDDRFILKNNKNNLCQIQTALN